MHRVPKLHTCKSRPSLIIACQVVCAAFWLAVPQIVWSQTGTATSQADGVAEGGRLFNAGNLAYQQGQLSEASRLWEQTRAIFTHELGEDDPSTLATINNLAATYSALGQHDKALALKEQTLKLRRAKLGENHPDTLTSMNNLAVTYSALGQYDKALAFREQTLKLMRAKLGGNHPDTRTAMNNLANTYSDLGQHDKALPLREQTLKLLQARLGENHPDTLTARNNLATTYSALAQHGKALAPTEKALKQADTKPGDAPPDTPASLATTQSALEPHDKALALNEQALKPVGDKPADTAPDTLASLATTYSDLGQLDKAPALNEQTLKTVDDKPGAPPDTPDTPANPATSPGDLGQHDQSLVLTPAIVAGAEKRSALPGLSTEKRESLFADHSDRYQQHAKSYASTRRFDEAFNLGDLSKASALTHNIETQVALRSLPTAEQQKLQAGEIRIQALQTQIDKLGAQGTRDSGAALALQKQLDAHNTDHLQLVANLNSRYPKYAQLASVKPASASQAKRLIGGGEVFVSYLVDTDGMAQAFVLDASGEAKWMDLGQIKNHAKTVAAYLKLGSPGSEDGPQGRLVALKDGGYQWLPPAQTAPVGASKVAEPLKVLNRYWHDTLIKPILPVAGPYPRWIISPDKDLALLPFDTLVEAFDATGKPAQTLVQTRTITLVQSFAMLALLKQRDGEYATLERPKDLFAMGNAVYGSGWADNRGIRRGGTRWYAGSGTTADRGYALAPMQASAEQTAMSQFVWQNLPETAYEVEAVSAVFNGTEGKDGASADSYLGPEASEGKLQQINQAGKLKDYRYLLFSAHGYLAQNPTLSSLVLSQQDNPPEIDGYVTAGEWTRYDMKSDLTVISACDTGVGRTQAGESLVALPSALFVAGNKNTLLNLWPVDDDATAEFMRRFFTKLKAGTLQPDALHQTKLEFRQHMLWNNPKYWAAFVLYGV